jgi:hypothetical protein
MPTPQDEGTALPSRTVLNFVGSGVTATDDSANGRTNVTVPGSQGGSSSLTFTTGSNLSNTVTINHNRGSATFAAGVTPTTMPASGVTLVVLNKTATTFQVQGLITTKVALTLNFDWQVI